MGKNRNRMMPFETEITSLDDRGLGVGQAPDGRPVHVRFAPPNARVAVRPQGRKRGVWSGRRTALVRPPPFDVVPACPRFALCGGCAISELSLQAQRHHKHTAAINAIGPVPQVHAIRGTDSALRYRNKLEFSFGPTRYLRDDDLAAGLPLDGRFVGLHAPGRFDRIVDIDPRDGGCQLGTLAMNAVLQCIRDEILAPPDASPPYDPHTHLGGWRHVVLRHAAATDELLVIFHTTSQVPDEEMERVVHALHQTEIDAKLVGCVWRIHDGVSDVATGEIKRVWGQASLVDEIHGYRFRIGPDTFFQTNTRAAEILYDTISEALGRGGVLLDLYCGSGSIGIVLSQGFDEVFGVEIVEQAVQDARSNAAENHVKGRWIVGPVEHAIASLAAVPSPRRIVVDPPRAGLHPDVTKHLATAQADVLVYVACRPASLGRDRVILEAGGWQLTDLWTVDLFPQTGHIEAVARFTRQA